MENLNWNEIVCIDLRSYNDESLAMIEEFFGIGNSVFIKNKKIGINKKSEYHFVISIYIHKIKIRQMRQISS